MFSRFKFISNFEVYCIHFKWKIAWKCIDTKYENVRTKKNENYTPEWTSEQRNDSKRTPENIENGYKKLYKSKRHENFWKKCLSHRVSTNFISLLTIAYKHLEKRQIEELEKQKIKISNLVSEFENNLLTFKLTFKNN